MFTAPRWSGDVVTWATDPAIKPPQQFVYSKKDANTLLVEWKVLTNESYVVGDTLTCERDSS